jgi:hypothetical protein
MFRDTPALRGQRDTPALRGQEVTFASIVR